MGLIYKLKLILGAPAAPQQDPEYMEQQSPTGDAKHLQEDTERAISKAAAEHDEKSPEALLNTVRNAQIHAYMIKRAWVFCVRKCCLDSETSIEILIIDFHDMKRHTVRAFSFVFWVFGSDLYIQRQLSIHPCRFLSNIFLASSIRP